jgi:hypothetical protein
MIDKNYSQIEYVSNRKQCGFLENFKTKIPLVLISSIKWARLGRMGNNSATASPFALIARAKIHVACVADNVSHLCRLAEGFTVCRNGKSISLGYLNAIEAIIAKHIGRSGARSTVSSGHRYQRVEDAVAFAVRDAAAHRRRCRHPPGRFGVVRRIGRQGRLVRAVGKHHIDIVVVGAVAVGMKNDQGTIGRPFSAAAVHVIEIRQINAVAAVGVHHPNIVIKKFIRVSAAPGENDL